MEGKKKRPLFFLLVLLLSHKANNVLFERMNGILLLECENEYVKNENGYKLATGHHYMDNDQIEQWLQGTDRSRRVKIEENVKYKYNVEELNTKYEQMKAPRINRILKESTYEAQNVADNNYIDDKANGEHKTDNKTNKGEGARNMVMLDYDISGSGQPDGIIDNVVELGTEDEGNFLENSSKGGDHPYRMNRKERMSNGVINQTFLQNNVMDKCNDKRKRGERDWDCPAEKDICISVRRYQLCMKGLTNLVNNTRTHSHNDITFLKLNLKRKLMYDAAVEGDLLLKKNNYQYNKEFCKDIRWGLGDFGDIIMGTNMEGIGYSQVVENNLRQVFGTDEKAKQDRKQWWNESKEHIWRAMMFSIRSRLKEKFVWICKKDVTLKVEPQIYRWIREWGRDYMSKLPKEQGKLNEKCASKLYYNNMAICMLPLCHDACKSYDQWITRKKKQWDVLSTKFSSVKKTQKIGTENIATAYDILKQELNGFKEATFENEINKRDNLYNHLCPCVVEEARKNTQENVKNVGSGVESKAASSNPITEAVKSSSGEGKVQEDSAHKSVNKGEGKSSTNEADPGSQSGAPASRSVDEKAGVPALSAGQGHDKVPPAEAAATESAVLHSADKTPNTVTEENKEGTQMDGAAGGDGKAPGPTVSSDVPSVGGKDSGPSTSASHALAGENGEVHNGTDTEPKEDGEKADPQKDIEVKGKQDTDDRSQGSLGPHTDERATLGETHMEKDTETAGGSTLTPEQNVSVASDNGNVPGSGNKQNEGATALSGAESLKSNESVHKTIDNTTHGLENKNGGNEKDFQKHDFMNNDMLNDQASSDHTSSDQTSSDHTSSDQTSSDHTSSDHTSSDQTSSDQTSSDQTIDTEGHHRDNVRNPEIKSSEDMSKGDFMRNSNSNELYSHNNLNNRKLNRDQYEHRDVKATREKIILMSEVNKCNNRASVKYCNTIEDRMLSSTCSRERRKNLCCSISDFCLNYFELYSYEFYNCMKKEFEDPSYECFTKGSSTGIVYFATGGAFLIILLLFASWNAASNDYEEEATFDEFVEYSDDIHRTPLMPNDIEHMQQFTPLDYS
uniref:Duffy receptor alpha form n=1 Tax=Plasmodium knowlesi TaxID=5850 RepID=PVDA_PLAKN|nr:RecName: Full=Duffy receptor alpha form; AltName: Full=Erythrocyte-binding protein; Flags: Precursor [Plasmodium knowlesi]AAA29602.1 erythrocyte binding protein [Plasmodium knowlesi]